MSEQTLQSTGIEAPFSHGWRIVAIIRTFATPGIVCANLYISPHKEGVGDYWFCIHDFDTDSVLGTTYPKLVHPSRRVLRFGVDVIWKLLIGYRVFEKVEYLKNYHSYLRVAEFQLMFNIWDKEVTQLMLDFKKRCNKFRDGSIEFSPVVGLWKRCLQAYRWISKYQNNLVPHPGNLFRLCRRLSIPSPSSLLVEEVSALEAVCIQKLADL
jgi:hypothetical protein